MRRNYLYSFVILILAAVTGCNRAGSPKDKAEQRPATAGSTLKYSKRFALAELENSTLVSLFGNRANHDTTESYVLARDTAGLRMKFPDKKIIKIPCKKIAALSSIYAAMLE